MKELNHQIEGNITGLLNSKITGYKISQDTGISQSYISRLRRDEVKLGNTKWNVIKTLNNYAEKHLS